LDGSGGDAWSWNGSYHMACSYHMAGRDRVFDPTESRTRIARTFPSWDGTIGARLLTILVREERGVSR
jgi:hypothetical protein